MTTEEQQLVRRYREALERIVSIEGKPWCDDYAMCDHAGCRASARALEIARAALAVDEVFWPA